MTEVITRYQTFDNQTIARVHDLMQQTGAGIDYAVAAITLADEEMQQASQNATRRSGFFQRIGLWRKK